MSLKFLQDVHLLYAPQSLTSPNIELTEISAEQRLQLDSSESIEVLNNGQQHVFDELMNAVMFRVNTEHIHAELLPLFLHTLLFSGCNFGHWKDIGRLCDTEILEISK